MKKVLIAASAFAFLATNVWSQAACKNRGDLDVNYCDENGDLVADLPRDQKKWKDPSTLVWAYTPVEDPAVYEKIFAPFTANGTAPATLTANAVGPVENPATCKRPERMASISAALFCT